MTEYKSFFGALAGIGKYGNLLSSNRRGFTQHTDAIAHAAITISAEGASVANTRDISIQLYDHKGKAIDFAGNFEILMFSSAAMTDFVATGGTTGVAQGVSGKLLAVVAKKWFRCISTVAGLWTGTYLDTGTDAGYLAVRLSNGRVIGGGLVTNA